MIQFNAYRTAGSAATRSFLAAALALLASTALAPAHAASETVLYSFQGGTGDGENPFASLINVGGTLYGTTAYGGASEAGTVFKVTTTGAETVLYAFGKAAHDGAYPFAGLADMGGVLYGTTANGGAHKVGTVFNVTLSGTETVMYSFSPKGKAGDIPEGGLTLVGTTLYGTCRDGGASNAGTVFKVSKAGSVGLLYAFTGANGDGAMPDYNLLNLGGTLYGITFDGGGDGEGTVFSVTKAGAEKVVYALPGGVYGAEPSSALLNVKGTLYGTTYYGGANGYGTVYAVTPSGAGTVIYSFQGGSDGAGPEANLINVGGTLYGTTSQGGGGSCTNGCGTVFKVTPSGQESVVYAFEGSSAGDGAEPTAGLIDVGGTLYGTTAEGGTKDDGTVFAITP